jgi:hypothetical protein
VTSLAGGTARAETTERLVKLSLLVGMDVSESRIKSHLSLSQSEYTLAFPSHRLSPSILMPRNKSQFKWGAQPPSVLHRMLDPLVSGLSPSVLVPAGPWSWDWASTPMYSSREKCHIVSDRPYTSEAIGIGAHSLFQHEVLASVASRQAHHLLSVIIPAPRPTLPVY